MSNQNFSVDQNVKYPKLLIREMVEDTATYAANIGHLVYRKIISNFTTSLVFVAINSFNVVL